MTTLTDSLGAFAAAWSQWVIAVSWQVGVVGLLVLVVSRLVPRSPASFRHLLWLLVLVKLAMPPSLSTPWSVGTILADRLSPLEIRVERPGADQTPPDPGSPFAVPEAPGTQSDAVPDAAYNGVPLSVMALAATSAIGVVLLAALIVRHRRFIRLALASSHPAKEATQAAFADWVRVLGIREPVTLLVSPAVAIPAAIGVRRPRVLIPDDLEERFGAAEIAQMLAHELGHVKRYDVLYTEVPGVFSVEGVSVE